MSVPFGRNLDRREFAGSLALAALAPLLRFDLPVFPHRGLDSAAPAIPAGQVGPVAQALAGVLRAQYGARLSEADLASITRQIEAGLERAEKIRKVPLGNGDEPDFVFSAVRTEPAV
jgi:hypothetical protein